MDNKLIKAKSNYKNARNSLLLLLVLSVVNVFSVFSNMYFLFSSRFSTLLANVGYLLYLESNLQIYLVVGMVLALIALIPYLLAFIFSKKKVGWLICGLVLFILDTIFLLIDVPSLLASGEVSIILDVIAHIVILVELILGVVAGNKLKNIDETNINQNVIAENNENNENIINQNENTNETRELTIIRNKKFVASLVPIRVFIDKNEVGKLKNGESITINIPARTVELGASFTNFPDFTQIIDNDSPRLGYTLTAKTGFSCATIEIEKL